MVEVLRLSGLTVGLPGHAPLIDGLSLSLTAGQRIGLVGASGCGKSLSAAAICGLLRPPAAIRAGSLAILGQEMTGAGPARWRRLRGTGVFQIFQSPGTALAPARRVGAQLAEAARRAQTDPRRAVADALDMVSLGREVAGLFPYQLSGGMKQRALIAMAMILRPAVLIADEPTTGLDVLTERDVLCALRAMTEETGAALLFISHDLRAVGRVTERVMVMEVGRLVAEGTVAGLRRAASPAARRLAEAAHALQEPC
ncbi:MAG: ATP-binding cassette domain-containing protein [Tropicimonas sp.]|uniref:ATP-binding cassette domain-containing protein n=1 Tax=Tropicimonas sp. TaxID=2067044 RepID=UPI003A861F5C